MRVTLKLLVKVWLVGDSSRVSHLQLWKHLQHNVLFSRTLQSSADTHLIRAPKLFFVLYDVQVWLEVNVYGRFSRFERLQIISSATKVTSENSVTNFSLQKWVNREQRMFLNRISKFVPEKKLFSQNFCCIWHENFCIPNFGMW